MGLAIISLAWHELPVMVGSRALSHSKCFLQLSLTR